MFRAPDHFMMFHNTWSRCKTMDRIGVDIDRSIVPIALPMRVIDEHGMGSPIKSAVSPSPRAEVCPYRDMEAPSDPTSDEEAGPWPCVDNEGIVVRHINDRRII